MIRFCGLLNFLLLLSSVTAHPMMGGDVDTTILPPSADMSTVSSGQETAISADEQIGSTLKPSMEESGTTITTAPITATAQIDSITDMNTIASTDAILSSITPSIVGMTNLFETQTTTLMDNTIQEPVTTTHLTSMNELSAMVETTTHSPPLPERSTTMDSVETNSVVSSETTTPSPPLSEQSTMVHSVEPNSVVSSETTTSSQPLFEQSTMVHSVVPPDTPSETMTTILPMTLPAAAIMTSSNQHANEMKPPGDTSTLDMSSLSSLLGNNSLNLAENSAIPNHIDGHAEVDNVLTMSSNEETTRMASSTDSKIDSGFKQTAPSAGATEPPKPQDTNELDNGNSGCHSVSTSLAVLSFAVLYVIV